MAIVFAIICISLIYQVNLKTGVFSYFVNNDSEMPIYSVDIKEKRVALTFDVGWGDQYINEILNVLEGHNTKATFFVLGTWAQRYPDAVRAINESGNEIGNHSTTHIKMTKIPSEKIKNEIKNAEECLMKITGKRTNLLRVPYGEYNNEVISTAKEMHYTIVQWNIDSLDTEGENAQDVTDRVISKANNGSIILFHTNSKVTVNALPEIINSLSKDGYKFIKVSDLLYKENYYVDNTGMQKLLK